jgi:hypothetical protein
MALLKKLTDRAGLALTEAQLDHLARLVESVILRVEEIARRQPEMSSADKATLAVQLLREKRPDLSETASRELIDAVLPRVRATLESGGL